MLPRGSVVKLCMCESKLVRQDDPWIMTTYGRIILPKYHVDKCNWASLAGQGGTSDSDLSACYKFSYCNVVKVNSAGVTVMFDVEVIVVRRCICSSVQTNKHYMMAFVYSKQITM